MSPARREFLQRLTIGGVAFGALPASLGAAESTAEPLIFNEFAALSSATPRTPLDVSEHLREPLRAQLQATLSSSYTLERELGGGGMSRVFVAEELRLRRKWW